MRRALRAGAVGLLAAAAVVLTWAPGSAWASAPEAQGWWYFPQQSGTPVALPAPPVVPADGLYVAQGPNGQNVAIAAVEYAVPGYVEATMTLSLAPGAVGTVAITACPAQAGFTPASAGAWDKAPAYNCTAASADGVVDAAGTTVKFTLPSAFVAASGTVMDVVLVPTPGAEVFQAPVAKPGDDSFQPSPLPGVPADTGPSPVADSGFSPAGDASSGSFAAPSGEPLGTRGSVPSNDPGGAAGAGTRRSAARSPVAVAAHNDPVVDRLVAVLVLVLMAGALWWLSGRPLPRAGGGAESAARMGGIGRFARQRSTAPNRL
jgi:hypothetical protein